MAGHLYYWVADWNLSRAEAELLLGDKGEDMIDCTHAALDAANPQNWLAKTTVRRFAGYVTGTPDIRWTSQDFDRLPADSKVLKIDQSDLDLPLRADAKTVKDIEGGASTIEAAMVVTKQRLKDNLDEILYADRAILSTLEDAVAAAGIPRGVIIGYQWASPTSNPHSPVPGTDITIGTANVDLSVMRWLPVPSKVSHAKITLTSEGRWNIEPEPGQVVETGVKGWNSKVRVHNGAWSVEPLPAS